MPDTIDLEGEPVTLEQAKAHLGVTSTIDDGLISGLVMAAREYAESYTGLILTAREVVETVDRFGAWVNLYAWPVREVISVAYLDSAGTEQTLDDVLMHVPLARRPVRITSAVGAVWPNAAALPGAVTITVQAGYATPSDVPQSIKQAMLLMVRHWYDNPSAVAAGGSGVGAVEVPLGARALLDRHRLQLV
jgi:uncharacterized phiE125 gp8 family phage protein